MQKNIKEYNVTNTNYNGSDYKSLNTYNAQLPGTVFIKNNDNIWSVTPEYSMNVQSVAQYNMPMNYNALTHGLRPDQMNSNGHFSVSQAYRGYASHCRDNQARQCGGSVPFQPMPPHTMHPMPPHTMHPMPPHTMHPMPPPSPYQ